MSGLPPVPRSFSPREDADSLAVVLKHTRPTTWRDRLPSLGRDLGIALGFMVFVGLFPNEEGLGPVWTLLTQGYDPASAFALVAVLGVVTVLVVGAEVRRRVEDVEATTEWVLERAGLRVEDDVRLPWHTIRSVAVDGMAIRVDLHDGGSVVGPASRHKYEECVALVNRLCAHVGEASVSDADRRALHDAARELADHGA